MAVTQTSYLGNGSTTNYSFTFPYLQTADVKCSIDATETTAFTLANATTIQFNTAPANGAKIKIFRVTDDSDLNATFYAGSAIRSSDLNDNFTQNLYSTQEVNARYLSNLGGTMVGDLQIGEDADIIFEGATDDANETKLTVADPTADRTITLPDATGTLLTTGDTGTVTGGMIANDAINSQHYVDGSIQTAHIASGALDNRYFTETEIANGAADTRYYTETELDAGQLDTRYYTETELDAGALDPLYFRQDSSETIASGQTWSAGDTHVATTAAIDARIIDLVDEVGGFDIVNDEQSFPDTNPGGTTGQAAVLSIKAATTDLVPSGTTVTISNGNLANNANITITGVPSTIAQGFGFLVESTSTLHTYTFHRLVPKATEVTTVASNATAMANVGNNIANVNAVNTNSSNINTVAGSITNVNNVGGSIANVNTVATNLTDINAFGDTYQIASSDPSARADSSSLQEGDLYFNTTSDELKVYNGGTWQGGVTASGNFATTTGNTFTGDNIYGDGVKANFGTHSDLSIFHDGADNRIESALGQNITIDPGGSGNLTLQTATSSDIQIQGGGRTYFYGTTNNWLSWEPNTNELKFTNYGGSVSLKAPNNINTATHFVLPVDGTANQFLKTDGNGVLSFDTIDLTSLSATNLTSGTIPDARFPAVLPAISAANLTNIPSTGGLTGGGNDELFIESDNVMGTDFTTGTNKNYLNLLPLTINATLTVTSGSNISFVSV